MRIRPSSRVLVFNPVGHVLLFKFVHRDGALAGQAYWATPGGGLDIGESFEAAAIRELNEETGIILSDPGKEVARREFILRMPDGEDVQAEERFFAVTSTSTKLSCNGWTKAERKVIAEHKWWSVAELEETMETVWPTDIAGLVQRLVVELNLG